MKNIFIIITSVFFTLSLVPANAQQGQITGGVEYEVPDWFKESFLEIAEDVEEAKDEGKHVLLFFHLNGCPYCNKMANETFETEPLKSQIQQNFDSIALNIKGDREIAMSEDLSTTERLLSEFLKVQYTPTILFLDHNNKTVLRLNGYRSSRAMQQALDFVQNKAYLKTSFSQYKRDNMQYGKYRFIKDPLIKSTNDLSKLQQPVALLFEDEDCNECNAFHRRMMKREAIREQLGRYQVVRLDAKSDAVLTDFSGNQTTPKAFAEKLNLNYRPGIVLFDQGREIARIESMLYPFHFENVLRFGLDKNYQQYPDYLALGQVRQQELLEKGIDVNLGKPDDWD